MDMPGGQQGVGRMCGYAVFRPGNLGCSTAACLFVCFSWQRGRCGCSCSSRDQAWVVQKCCALPWKPLGMAQWTGLVGAHVNKMPRWLGHGGIWRVSFL